MSVRVERRYALTRVKAGDYVCPSNDGRTLWRIFTYQEEGSLETEAGRQITGTFWACAKYDQPLQRRLGLPDDFLEWEHWEAYEGLLRTKRDALAAVPW